MNTFPVTIDTVLQLFRRLSSRERLRVLVQVLPDLEQDLPATSPTPDFWEEADLHVLAERQGVRPVENLDAFLGGWPGDEPIDDFIMAVREWRRQNPAKSNPCVRC